jgi:hypothetical protein
MGKAEGSQRLCKSASKAVQGLKALNTSGCPKAKQSVKLCTETPWFALVHQMNSQPFSKEVGQATEAERLCHRCQISSGASKPQTQVPSLPEEKQ